MIEKLSLIFFIYQIFIKAIYCEEELQLLIELFRHGSRREYVPHKFLSEYPDPYIAPGELTGVGYRQHYLLGKAIRKKYKDFLPEKYTYDNVEIYSSNRNRTLASAMAQAIGLFDLGTGDIIENDNKKFYNPPIKNFDIEYPQEYGQDALPYAMTMIPIYTPGDQKNTLFVPQHECPILRGKMDDQVIAIRNQYNSTFAPLYQELLDNDFYPQAYGGKDYYDFTIADKVCDILISRQWADDEFSMPGNLQDQCEYLTFIGEMIYFGTEDIKSTYLTEILIFIKKYLKDKQENKNKNLKLLMLSGHDFNISGFLMWLIPHNLQCSLQQYNNKYGNQNLDEKYFKQNLQDQICYPKIPFASQLIFELFKADNEQLYLRILYNNEPFKVFKNFTQSEIKLSDFMNMIDKILDQNYVENCGLEQIPEEPTITNGYLIVWIFSLIILITLIFILFQKRKERDAEDITHSIDEDNLIIQIINL